MKNIKLVVDGTIDLPKELIDMYGIQVVPLTVRFKDEIYTSGIDIDNQTFYQRMSSEKELPKTACPAPDKFVEAYHGDDDVLVLTITQGLSATYNSAVIGKQMYEEDGGQNNVVVVDSEQGSIALGLMAVKTCRMIKEGFSFDQILEQINLMKQNVFHFGALETLDNAIKGGRINRVAGALINALNFKAVIQIVDNAVKPIDKARGELNSIKKVLDYIEKSVGDGANRMVAIGHANCLEKAEKIKQMIQERFHFTEIIVSEIGPVIGTYAAEGAFLIATL